MPISTAARWPRILVLDASFWRSVIAGMRVAERCSEPPSQSVIDVVAICDDEVIAGAKAAAYEMP